MTRKFALLLHLCCLVPAGCTLQPTDVPAVLGAVLQNKAAFRPNGNSPILDVAPGTPMDAIQDRLAGCWGKVLDEDGAAIIPLAESLVFAQDGTYERCQYGTLTPLLAFLVRETGTYEIVDAGRLRLTRLRSFAQQPGGSLEEVEAGPLEMIWHVTISGDSMTFVLTDDVDSLPANERALYLYHRLDCP